MSEEKLSGTERTMGQSPDLQVPEQPVATEPAEPKRTVGPQMDPVSENEGYAAPVSSGEGPEAGWNPQTGEYRPSGGANHPDKERFGRDWSVTDYLYQVLVHPRQAFSAAAEKKPLGLALSIVLGTSLINLIVNTSLADRTAPFHPPGVTGDVFGNVVAGMSIFAVSLGIIMWFVMAGFFNLVGELLGGRGNAKGLLTALGLAYWPSILLAPVNLAGQYLPGGKVIQSLGLLAVTLWGFVLQVLAIRESLYLSTGRSLLVIFFPLIVLILLFALMAAVMISFMPFANRFPIM
ncbi:YIP1 family protein [Heliobacterium chlorum]|uniref:YIP1 family protein n=1 Tax=Heliobacterium chlorum TaxID=2698 RepID=A0ABR7T1J5_HELCL|nr:Yip1 family protein [Heliobacterium chlorum]MBC9784546.1 YIP1 family protein [Heliobacterium chlorum]